MYLADNELELAMVTRNRPEFVTEWLDENYAAVRSRNISVSIWDSSDARDTEQVVKAYNQVHGCQIGYHGVDPAVDIGHKPVFPMLHSTAKYVWIIADRRSFFWEKVEERILPLLRFNLDSIALQLRSWHPNERIFADLDDYSQASVSSITTIGMLIIQTQVFQSIRENAQLRQTLALKYQNAQGWAFIGYVYEALAMSKGVNAVTTINLKQSEQQSQCSWLNKYTQIMFKELFAVCDGLPAVYFNRRTLPRNIVQEVQGGEIRDKWLWQAIVAGGITTADRAWILSEHILEQLYEPQEIEHVQACLSLTPVEAAAALSDYDEAYAKLNQQCLGAIFARKIQPELHGRKLILWGLGIQVRHVEKFLAQHDVPVAMYVDQNGSQMNLSGGRRVSLPQDIGSPAEFYVLITTRYKYASMWDILHHKGYTDHDFCWVFQDFERMAASFVAERTQGKPE